MASCYHCGRTGADYRRSVQTSRSYNSWTSKKSSGSSSRSTYALRSLCESCAASVDRHGLIMGCVMLCFLASGLIYYIYIKVCEKS